MKKNNLKKKILIVDDDKAILEALKISFEEIGYLVKTTSKGSSALQSALVFKPNLILLDYLLSNINGQKIAKQIKEKEQTKNIPIVMFSAHPAVQKTGDNSGIDDFIAKPFDFNKLVELIERYIS